MTAFDSSAAMIALARQRNGPTEIDYRVIDATDREALLGLGSGAFDNALCNMARALVHVPSTELLTGDGTPKAAKDIWEMLNEAGVPVCYADDPDIKVLVR